MSIEEKGNRILAYFMKVEYSKELNYHEDWNKLMSVWTNLPTTYHENGDRVNMDYIINNILSGDVRHTWSVITGYVNKYVLKEEEYLKFK